MTSLSLAVVRSHIDGFLEPLATEEPNLIVDVRRKGVGSVMNRNDPRLAEGDPPSEDTPAARALAEAQNRRRQSTSSPDRPPEINGRPGPEPVRYGDWENKGIASDF